MLFCFFDIINFLYVRYNILGETLFICIFIIIFIYFFRSQEFFKW